MILTFISQRTNPHIYLQENVVLATNDRMGFLVALLIGQEIQLAQHVRLHFVHILQALVERSVATAV